MEKFTTAFRGAKIQLKRTHVSELNISGFTTYMKKASLMYVVNLEMDNSLKLGSFIIISGQITSDALWK